MSIWGDDLDGRNYNDKWVHGCTVTRPPEDYRWHHSAINVGHGKDEVSQPYDDVASIRAMRLAWLDQFELEITEEGDYRWWRWYDQDRKVRWSERRLLSVRLPKVPGFWPADE